jgi:uncharacterized protein YbbC (DUF1343 family)
MAARTADGEPSLLALAQAKDVRLAAIFSPEHGLEGTREGPVGDDVVRGVPQYSLYGATRKPSAEMLAGLDLLVIDLVDVGTRFYTYMSTLHAMLRAAAESHVPLLVLDRPNPIGGVAVEGPVLDDGVRSFVNHFSLPIRHGMTAGELSLLINSEEHLGAALQVVWARDWCRDRLFAQTGLRWTNPSPNLRSATTALLYPAVALLESTNLSVGRGTDQPFFVLGAPFIDASALLAELQHAQLPGVGFTAVTFTPTKNPHAGERCQGVRLQLLDARAFMPVRTGLELAHALHKLYPERWQADKLIELLGHAQTMRALLAGADEASLEPLWQPRLGQFLERRERFLHYPRCEQP